MSIPRVVATIVAWNSMTFLPDVIASLKKQCHKNLSIIVVDNASTDDGVEFLRDEHPDVVILRNAKNLGFSHGHNQAIRYAKTYLKKEGEELFILVTNPDVVLEESFLSVLLGRLSDRPGVGCAGGKLLKMHREGEDVLAHHVKTDSIDSVGIRLFRSRRAIDRREGENDTDAHFMRTEEVFGISGALALYRLSALEDVAYRGEFFDKDFFAYKEDIDLAWRLRLRGWGVLYVPFAKAYHVRSVSGTHRKTIREKLRSRRGRSSAVKFYSYRNHFLLLLKNDYVRNVIFSLPFIAWYELRKLFFILIFEPRTLLAIGSMLRLMPRIMKKRRVVMGRAKVTPQEIRKWFR